ncbi:MAG: hypothetical protein V4596_00220 [Bdellovibrionota bacterium]
MKILILTLALFLVSCGKEDETNTEKPTISQQEYNKLKALSPEALLSKASTDELGVCTIEAVSCTDMAEGCDRLMAMYHFVKLTDKNVYFPSMISNKSDLKSVHGQYPQTYVKLAFDEGYCYNVEF